MCRFAGSIELVNCTGGEAVPGGGGGPGGPRLPGGGGRAGDAGEKQVGCMVGPRAWYRSDGLLRQVRASNMVRAGESLMKLVSDLKQYLILNDFPSVNDAISQNSNMFKEMQVCL